MSLGDAENASGISQWDPIDTTEMLYANDNINYAIKIIGGRNR